MCGVAVPRDRYWKESQMTTKANPKAFNGIKVFFATMFAQRQTLGETVTAWLADAKVQRPGFRIVDIVVRQSSDNAFHGISITVFSTRISLSRKRTRAMADHDPVNNDTWLEFLGPPGVESWCGLCGNSGIVDTRGKVESPRGDDCGVRTCCICPNGRAIKHQLGGELPPEAKPQEHTPRITLDATMIVGCACGWRTPPGTTDSDDAFASHCAISAAGRYT